MQFALIMAAGITRCHRTRPVTDDLMINANCMITTKEG
jgi:hypothetical protein